MNLKMSYNSFIKLKDFFKIVDITAEVKDYLTKNEMLEGTLEINGKFQKRDGITENYFSESIPFSVVFKNDNFDVNDIVCTDIDYVAIDGRGVDVTFDILVDYYEYENIPIGMNDNVNNEFVVEVAEEIDANTNQCVESMDIDDRSSIEKSGYLEEVDEEIDVNNYLEESTSATDNRSLDTSAVLDEEVENKTLVTELEKLNLDTEQINNEDLEEIKKQETNRIDDLLKSTLNFKDDNLPTQEVIVRNIPDKKSKLKVCYYQNDQDLESVCEKNNVSLNRVFKENKSRNIEKYHRVIIKEANE